MTKIYSLNHTIINCKIYSPKSLIKTTVLGLMSILISSSVVQAEDLAMLNIIDKGNIPVVSTNAPGTASISSVVFNDANGNDHSGIHVKIFDEKGLEINVGPDGILGNDDDSPGGVVTDEEGRYKFQNISQNFYRIKVVSSNYKLF